ncbi:hypothetical protein M2123_002065 [Polynucleobacter sphagniphilus]|jgi:hypothetical protein|nr:hypothetical protein [Polynucleobacter sphagniphilus]
MSTFIQSKNPMKLYAGVCINALGAGLTVFDIAKHFIR